MSFYEEKVQLAVMCTHTQLYLHSLPRYDGLKQG